MSLKFEETLQFLFNIAKGLEPCGKAKIASALVSKNKILNVGWNHYKTNPFYAKFAKNPEAIYAHAENHVILKVLKDVGVEAFARLKPTLFVCRARINPEKHNKGIHEWCFGSARPCSGCWQAICELGVKQVVFSLDNNGFECVRT